MSRSCVAKSTDKLFDADKCISDLEEHIASILYIVGLDPSLPENLVIDNIIVALRETFSLKTSVVQYNPAHLFTHQTYNLLLNKLQVSFFNLQIAQYGKTL